MGDDFDVADGCVELGKDDGEFPDVVALVGTIVLVVDGLSTVDCVCVALCFVVVC